MRPSSAKNKGRRLQQFVRDTLLRFAKSLEPDDIRSTAMGQGGEDIQLSPAARKIYPWSIECKNVEKLNVWKAIEQTESNCNGHTPLVVFKKNGKRTYVTLPFDIFMKIYTRNDDEKVSDS